MEKIKSLILSSPFEEPTQHHEFDEIEQTYKIHDGRRIAGYLFSSGEDDLGKFVELELVNKIRPLVKSWRESNYPGITPITRELLEHWRNPNREQNFFFCQIEAIETLIFLNEVRNDIKIPSDGIKHFQRLCTKLCTGGGKTIVMAMLIAYMILNKVRYRNDDRFSLNILIVAPNLTVKDRLSVLLPSREKNYYEQFEIVPPTSFKELHKGRFLIINWHKLLEKNDKPAVDKRGAKSDEAYLHDIDDGKFISKFRNTGNFIVINDEAHHAWRIENPNRKIGYRGEEKKEFENIEHEATIWISGLDRIHRARNIRRCYDFSATPFIPRSGKKDQDKLFGWIVSDFGLYDGIESGIVKTPMLVRRTDGDSQQTIENRIKPDLFHVYKNSLVKSDLTDKSMKEESPLPALVQTAYEILSYRWKETFDLWQSQNRSIPPVMITATNSTMTSARIKYAFENQTMKNVPVELCEPDKILRIDSKVFGEDSETEGKTLSEKEKQIRNLASTVGQEGKDGYQIRNVISVGMLSEGWDAKNVTQIMGLRAFSSQLLCEQVVGRGLRRINYQLDADEKFEPLYVDVVGIPMNTLLMAEYEPGKSRQFDRKMDAIKPLPERDDLKIVIPNILRVNRRIDPKLTIDFEKLPILYIKTNDIISMAELGAVVDSDPDSQRTILINLRDGETRFQTVLFNRICNFFDERKIDNPTDWQKSFTKFGLVGRILRLVQDFLESDKIKLDGEFATKDLSFIYVQKIDQILNHLWNYIECEGIENFEPMFNERNRVISTGDMIPWYTRRPNEITKKSHINRVVTDSSWEDSTAFKLDNNKHVVSWVKNDHLGFSISYNYMGEAHRYIPDFIVKLDSGEFLILETKGNLKDVDKAKFSALELWVKAVNKNEEFGTWNCAMSRTPQDVDGIIDSLI